MEELRFGQVVLAHDLMLLDATLSQDIRGYAVHAVHIELWIVAALQSIGDSRERLRVHLQRVHDEPLDAFALAPYSSVVALWASEVLRTLVLDENVLVVEGPVAKVAEWATRLLASRPGSLLSTHGTPPCARMPGAWASQQQT